MITAINKLYATQYSISLGIDGFGRCRHDIIDNSKIVSMSKP
jgi:hypothetical protein